MLKNESYFAEVDAGETQEFNLYLNDSPNVLAVLIKGGLKRISLINKDGETFVRVETDNNGSPEEQRLIIEVHPTGAPLSDIDDITYIGTAFAGSFVWHIFYLVQDNSNSQLEKEPWYNNLYIIYKYTFDMIGSTIIEIDSPSVKPLYAGFQYDMPTLWAVLKLNEKGSDGVNARASLNIKCSEKDNEDGYTMLNDLSLSDGAKRNVFFNVTYADARNVNGRQNSMRFRATNKKTGKSVEFGWDDLYGYEGEVCGVILKEIGVLVYNEGSDMYDYTSREYTGLSKGGLNPDVEIELI